jgi:hypothetical protein
MVTESGRPDDEFLMITQTKNLRLIILFDNASGKVYYARPVSCRKRRILLSKTSCKVVKGLRLCEIRWNRSKGCIGGIPANS